MPTWVRNQNIDSLSDQESVYGRSVGDAKIAGEKPFCWSSFGASSTVPVPQSELKTEKAPVSIMLERSEHDS